MTRIKDNGTTATSPASDDYLLLDGDTNGSRRILPANIRPFRGALVYKGSNQTGANFTTATAITFDSESYDTDAIHSTSSNTSRLTVPSGVTYVRLVGSCSIENNSSSWCDLAIWKNAGFAYAGWAAQRFGGANGSWNMNISSPVQAVTAGDYFEMFLQSSTDTSIDLNASRTWFAMEIIA